MPARRKPKSVQPWDRPCFHGGLGKPRHDDTRRSHVLGQFPQGRPTPSPYQTTTPSTSHPNSSSALGALDRLAAAVPSGLMDVSGNVPGSFLQSCERPGLPDRLRGGPVGGSGLSSSRTSGPWTRTCVSRAWTLDEMPLASGSSERSWRRCIARTASCVGPLRVRGRRAAPDAITAPLLSVVDALSDRPASVRPAISPRRPRSPERRLLWYEGDTRRGRAAFGMLVGRSAHRRSLAGDGAGPRPGGARSRGRLA